MGLIQQGWQAAKTKLKKLIVGTPPDYTEFESDGTMMFNGEATTWDDLRFPLTAAKLDTSAGRIDYNFDDCTVDFQDNAKLTDPACIVAQFQHKKLLGSAVELHVHWLQNQNKVPNFLIGYRWINLGEAAIAVGSEQYLIPTGNLVTYAAGTIHQLTEFGMITKSVADTLSSILQIRIFRDTANTSGLFAGADGYTGTVQVLEFDLHYEIDSAGSREEFIK